MSSEPVLRILSSDLSSQPERALATFARFLGVSADIVLATEDGPDFGPAGTMGEGNAVLAIGFGTWRRFAHRPWADRLLGSTSFALIFGHSPDNGPSTELAAASGGALTGFADVEAGELQVEVIRRRSDSGGAVAAVSTRITASSTPVFVFGAETTRAQRLVSLDGQPYGVSIPVEGGSHYFLAEGNLVDLDAEVTPDSPIKAWSPQLFSLSFFLRDAFGDHCWTAPTHPANFIVDDPYLRSRYGFVTLDELPPELRRTGIALTIAFIPFNYRRSRQRIVDQLKACSDLFSIAVHGCDHTEGEFSSSNLSWLEGTAAKALERMDEHQRRTGMPYDKVMVFPKGRFSTQGIQALKRCGFEAAVNSSVWPEDWRHANVRLRDLLAVAVTSHHAFPVFGRRYPSSVYDLAFDAEFQKPILGVEHHEYFRDGFAPLETFARELGDAVHHLKWCALDQALASSYVVRRQSRNVWALRHFVGKLSFTNSSSEPWTLNIEKPETSGDVESVEVNGQSVPFRVQDGTLTYSVLVPAGATIAARVIQRSVAISARKVGPIFLAKVCLRRWLSDFRDNYLAKNTFLLKAARALLKRLRGQG
jgi:peptidoglycan/xylan/chitin deacetylase (PgdA/CDA1 family)